MDGEFSPEIEEALKEDVPVLMLEELEELVAENEDRFTEWELEFLEDMRKRVNEDRDLTDGMIEKLTEIYEERAD